jgi:hypothetical protein
VSIGVVVCCSAQYAHHLPGWYDSVRNLNTQPAHVVVVTDSVVPDFNCTTVLMSGEFAFGKWLNAGVNACPTDWVAWIGVDDRYRPHALDGIERDDVDAVAFGLQYSTGLVWPSQGFVGDVEQALQRCPVPCGSPFRKALWAASPFVEDQPIIEDWAFWVGLVKHGARIGATGRIDVDYDYGDHHTIPDHSDVAARVRAWAQA